MADAKDKPQDAPLVPVGEETWARVSPLAEALIAVAERRRRDREAKR